MITRFLIVTLVRVFMAFFDEHCCMRSTSLAWTSGRPSSCSIPAARTDRFAKPTWLGLPPFSWADCPRARRAPPDRLSPILDLAPRLVAAVRPAHPQPTTVKLAARSERARSPRSAVDQWSSPTHRDLTVCSPPFADPVASPSSPKPAPPRRGAMHFLRRAFRSFGQATHGLWLWRPIGPYQIARGLRVSLTPQPAVGEPV